MHFRSTSFTVQMNASVVPKFLQWNLSIFLQCSRVIKFYDTESLQDWTGKNWSKNSEVSFAASIQIRTLFHLKATDSFFLYRMSFKWLDFAILSKQFHSCLEWQKSLYWFGSLLFGDFVLKKWVKYLPKKGMIRVHRNRGDSLGCKCVSSLIHLFWHSILS